MQETGHNALRSVRDLVVVVGRELYGAVEDFEYREASWRAHRLHQLIRVAAWITLAGAALWAVQLGATVLTTQVAPPPPPEAMDQDLARTALFNILALVLAGPVAAFALYWAARFLWHMVEILVSGRLPRIFHPLVQPVMAVALVWALWGATGGLAEMFWGSYYWLVGTLERALEFSPTILT